MNEKKMNFLFRGDAFIPDFEKYFSKKHSELRKKMQERNKRIEIKEFSYRIINHWEQNGLVEVDREGGTGWRKYSVCDLIWMKIIAELRGFGVSIESLKKVKNSLSQYNDQYSSPFPLLEYNTALFLLNKNPVYLLVFDDFQTEIGRREEIEIAEKLGSIGNYLKINLHDIFQAVFSKADLTPNDSIKIALNDGELALLSHIRSSQYSKITVKLKGGKILKMDRSVERPEQLIHKLLQEKNYDTITIHRENGNVVSVSQEIKEKL